ncbi:MAG: T9SS type A sorting domain-containing protein [Bacteroidota bacterium]
MFVGNNENGVSSNNDDEELYNNLNDRINILSTFSEGVYVQFNFDGRTKIVISVYNILGQKVMNDIEEYMTSDRIKLNLPDDSKGVYTLRIKVKNQFISKKIVY